MIEATSKTRLYNIYSGMKQRCYNPKNSHFNNYGARGITICDEWMGDNGLQNFMSWSLNNGYNETLTIDRIDSNQGYSPNNCQWVTASFNSMKVNSDFQNFVSSPKYNDIRNEIKSYIAKSGMTLTEIVAEYNKTHEPTTTQNISNKLTRGTIKYSECLALAEIMGYDITWKKRG